MSNKDCGTHYEPSDFVVAICVGFVLGLIMGLATGYITHDALITFIVSTMCATIGFSWHLLGCWVLRKFPWI